MEELIVHPRTQQDFYQGRPDMKAFGYAAEKGKSPVCYNGDILTVGDLNRFTSAYPQIDKVMIGRGFLRDPGLILRLQNKEAPGKELLLKFHDKVYEGYKEEMAGPKSGAFKMKELWALYWDRFLQDAKSLSSSIRKAEKLEAYEAAVKELFEEYEMTGKRKRR